TGDSAAATKKKSYDSQQQQPPQSSQLASLTGDSTPAGGGGGKKKKEKEKKGSAGADAELILPKILKHRRLENSVSDLSMVGHQGAPSGPASTIHASQSNCPSQIVKNSSFRDFMILLYIFGSSFVKKIQLFTKMNIKNKWFLFALFCFIAMSVYYNSFIGGMLSAGIIAALVNGLVDFVFAPKFAPGLPKHLQDISKTMYVQDVRDRTINIIDNIGKNEYTLKTVGFISMEFDASRPKLVTNLDSVEIVLMDGVLTLIHLRDNLKKYIDCFDPVFASILENDQFSVAIEDYRIYNTAKTKLDRTYQRSTPICIEYKYQINSSSLSEGDTTKSNDDRSSTKNKPPQSNNFSRIDCRLRKFYIYFQSTFDKYNWMNYLQQASCGINPSFGLQNIMDLKINATEDVKFSSESMGHQFKNIIDYMTFVESSLNLKYLQRPKQVLGSIDIQDSFLPADVYPSAFVLTVFINRLFWEIAHQKYFHDFASKIITNQLQKFILPDYISAPALKKFDFGKNAPKVTDMRHPFLDNQGLWFYVDIECKHGSSISCSSIFNLQQLLLKSKNDKEGKKGKNENTDSVFTDAEK
ncbi:MAG: Tabersonine 6,7-epoxidase isoform 2, partial [Marteilia pararefringens]